MPGPTVLTIGNFDAVHLGHQALVSAARERAGKQGRVLVLAFDPHPASILRPRDVPPRLTDWPRREAQRLLGRFYEIRGEVVEGEKRGRRLGVPTANIAADTMLPGDGVYFGQATGPDGRLFPAAINVGVKPTFGPARRGCEVHLIDAGLPANAYGWWCTVAFHGFLRGELRFDGPEAVAAQICRDIGRARELLTKRAIAS